MYWVVGLRGSIMQFEAGFEWPSLPDHKVWGLACGLVMLRRGQRRSPALPSPRGASAARSALRIEPLLSA
jgi:hypothetical protein